MKQFKKKCLDWCGEEHLKTGHMIIMVTMVIIVIMVLK